MKWLVIKYDFILNFIMYSIGITLSRFMMETTIANPHLRNLESIIMSIQTACKAISSVIEVDEFYFYFEECLSCL